MDLYIFDFDDTLAITDSRVRVGRNGQDFWMTSREFAEFPLKPGDDIDFSDFSRAQGTLIQDTVSVMLEMMNRGEDVFIVTARAVSGPVEDWLNDEIGQSPPIVATAGSHGKKPWLLGQLRRVPYQRVIVYEDCTHNIRSLKEAVEEHNQTTGENVFYSAMCIMPNQTVTQVESRWRQEDLLTESDFRNLLKNFLRKTL
jgi:hypothetical protein